MHCARCTSWLLNSNNYFWTSCFIANILSVLWMKSDLVSWLMVHLRRIGRISRLMVTRWSVVNWWLWCGSNQVKWNFEKKNQNYRYGAAYDGGAVCCCACACASNFSAFNRNTWAFVRESGNSLRNCWISISPFTKFLASSSDSSSASDAAACNTAAAESSEYES